MKNFARPRASARRAPEDDVQDTNLGRGTSVKSLGLGRFRTLRPNDRIIETSLSRKSLRNKVTQVDKFQTVVQDTPSALPMFDEDDAFEVDDRARRALALLLRKESRELLERVLTTDDPVVQRQRLGELLLSSHDMLYSFSRLVAEGGLTTSDRRLKTTALTDRILEAITENTKS
jgi:hypothetical protein